MSRKIPVDSNLYDSVYENNFPENQFYVLMFDETPSKFANKKLYHKSIIDVFHSMGFKKQWQNDMQKRNYDIIHEVVYISTERRMLLKVDLSKHAKDNLVIVDFLYDLSLGEIEKQLSFGDFKSFEREKKRSNINLVKSESGYLDTEEFDIDVPDIDLELNYGKDFAKIHEVIVKRLNTDRDKGIILLHGDPGTGKTSYLRYLTRFITKKEILFIPPSMAEMLAEPSIIPFLIENKNCVLIIEDAEKVISDRETNASAGGVSNILNLTDGILGDCLNVQIIATFNIKRERIDQALLRKGRLIAEHKFEQLSIEETNKLLLHLNKTVTSDKPLSLADIYNIDSDEIRAKSNKNKIGFKI